MSGIRTYIQREGRICDVTRDMGTTTDVLNNRTESFQSVGSTRAIQYKPEDSRLVETDTGSYEVDMVRYALPSDTIAEDGDRLVDDGSIYELRVIERRGAHAEADAKLVQ